MISWRLVCIFVDVNKSLAGVSSEPLAVIIIDILGIAPLPAHTAVQVLTVVPQVHCEQLRVDPDGRSFGLDLPHDHRVPIGPDNRLLLVPSVYVWPHVRVNCDAPWPLSIVYRAPFLVTGLRHATPPELVRLLKALADPTRLRILELVAKQPRSTQELAPLVSLTDAGASKQLRLLAATGLLTTKRDGYYVGHLIAFPSDGSR